MSRPAPPALPTLTPSTPLLHTTHPYPSHPTPNQQAHQLGVDRHQGGDGGLEQQRDAGQAVARLHTVGAAGENASGRRAGQDACCVLLGGEVEMGVGTQVLPQPATHNKTTKPSTPTLPVLRTVAA